MRIPLAIALLATALTGCAGDGTDDAGSTRPSDGRVCAVTLPNGDSPPGEVPRTTFHGGPRLWTLLPAHGVVIVDSEGVAPAGSMHVKFPWWAVDVEGDLRLTGHRLDRQSNETLRADRVIPSRPESGFRGSFWSSRLTFPSPGCWTVQADAGSARLSVTMVVLRG